jgi:hypothetical protein
MVLAAALLTGGSLTSKADQPGSDWMPAEQVKEKVMQAGYKSPSSRPMIEGEGVKDGRKMDFHADPKTGQIAHEKLDV